MVNYIGGVFSHLCHRGCVVRAKIREILEECIEQGIDHGLNEAHKYVDEPPINHVIEKIDNAIWFEIDERFDFERNVYNEVMEGLDHLPKHLRPKLLHPLEQGEEPRDGEIRAVNYLTGGVEDGWPIFKHRLDQYYSGEWREIKVYDEDKDGNLSVRETGRLRAKKKQIYEDLKDMVYDAVNGDAVDDAVDRKGEGLKWFLFEENGEEYFFPASTDAEALESAKKRGATLVREATKCEYTCEGNREWVGLTDHEILCLWGLESEPQLWGNMEYVRVFGREIEAQLKVKNT